MEFDFEKNGIVEAINVVPEKYHGLYSAGAGDNEGKFVLSDAAKPLVAEFIGVTNTLAGVRVDKKKVTDENAERRLSTKAVEDFAQSIGLEVTDDGVAAALRAFIDDLQGQVKGGKEIKINLAKINTEWEGRFSELGASKDAELGEMRGALEKHLISDAATRALAEAKGSVDLLLPHVQRQCKVVRASDGNYSVTVLDEQGDSRFDSAGGLFGVNDLVAEMKTQDKFGRAFESETQKQTGNGAVPGSLNKSNVQLGQQNRELSPVEKIRVGLAKGQAVQGRGGSTTA